MTAPITAAEAKDAIAQLADGLCQDHTTRSTADTLRLQQAAQTAHAFVKGASFHVVYEEFDREFGPPCNAPCPDDRFFCSRHVGHDGPHLAIAARHEETHDFCAVWSAERVADAEPVPADGPKCAQPGCGRPATYGFDDGLFTCGKHDVMADGFEWKCGKCETIRVVCCCDFEGGVPTEVRCESCCDRSEHPAAEVQS